MADRADIADRVQEILGAVLPGAVAAPGRAAAKG